MNKKSTICYILHTRPFKETSLILNLFSQQYGRFSLLAKGVKRKNAQAKRAILQPFNLLEIEYVGRSELKILSNVELKKSISESAPSSLINRALACGYYLNELLMRSLQEWQEFERLFDVYDKSLTALKCGSDYSAILRRFEVSLLEELGVAPQWQVDVKGEPICNKKRYHFNPEQGFEIIEKNSESKYLYEHNSGFCGDAILSLGLGQYKPEVTKNCQQITQMMLREIIGDKPLESRKLWL